MMAVINLNCVVIGLVADQRADEDQLVHPPRQPWKHVVERGRVVEAERWRRMV